MINIPKKTKIIILFIVLLCFVMIMSGISYSYFIYNQEVATAIVESGNINIDFSNSNSNLSLLNLVPMSDSMGVISNNYVDFTVTGTVDTEKIYYEVYLLEKDGNTVNPDYIKVYLTDQNDVKVRDIQIYSSLPDSEKQNGKRIYRDVVEPNSNGTEKTETKYFRLRMWLDENYTATSSSVFAASIYLYAYNVPADFFIPTGANVMKRAIANKTSCTPTTTSVNSLTIGGVGDVTYFTGNEECVDFNYVWYSGKLWRITAIYPDGTMKLVTENVMTSIQWGSSQTFKNSYVEQWLSEEFLPTLYANKNIVVQDAEWNSTINSTVGLLSNEEVTLAGGYGYVINNSYLTVGQEYWLLVPTSVASSNGYGIRPSIYLNNDVEFTNRNEDNVGKRNNPYRILGDKPIGNQNELLNERLSGEYVVFNDDLYRIVETNNNGPTKIVKANYVYTESNGTVSALKLKFARTYAYGSGDSDSYWDYYLNNTWYNELPSEYKNMIVSSTFYLGIYDHHYNGSKYSNYKTTICSETSSQLDSILIKDCTKYTASNKIYNGYVGMLRVGEMFSSQQSTTTHIFSFSSYDTVFLISPWDYTYKNINYIPSNGDLGRGFNSVVFAKPSMYLKPGVTITGGSGTVFDPYTIILNS